MQGVKCTRAHRCGWTDEPCVGKKDGGGAFGILACTGPLQSATANIKHNCKVIVYKLTAVYR